MELSPSSNRWGRPSLNPFGGGPEGVAFRALEVWKWEVAVARTNGDVVDCRSTAEIICGLAARRATGLNVDAMMKCC